MEHPIQNGPNGVELALRAMTRFADRTVFRWEDGELTGRGGAALIARMQAVFVAAGLSKPARVALLSGNRADVWCAATAANGLGLVITWLHPLGSLSDHQDQIDDAQAQVLIVDVPAYQQRGGDLAAVCAGLTHTFTLGAADFGVDLIAAAHRIGEQTAVNLALPDDDAILNYTGGTTGKSKGALRRHRAAGASTAAILADFELPDTPQYLAVAPITHVAGTKVLPCLLKGGTVHLMRGFDPEKVLRTIEARRINMTLLVPTMIYLLLDHPALSHTHLSSLELLLYGASPMSPTRLIEGLERIGPVFSQLYGQTECYPISVLRKADHDPANPERFASCGRPITSTDVCLLGEDGQPVRAGEAGEICVRGPCAMDGYWKRPELTAETFHGGWLHTGDIARADEEGFLYIVDRKKDMIVTGGFNVFPREVEDALTAHEAVAMAAVVGIPDAKWGEAVTALVVRRPGAQVQADVLQRWVRDRKGAQQAPKRIEFVDTLPLTALGKIDKKVLRQRYWEGQDRQVG